MRKVLFNGVHDVPDKEVIEKMNYFIKQADTGMNLFENNRKGSLQLANELRKELEMEYKNNELLKVQSVYENHILFSNYYRWAVLESLNSITGPMSYEKLHGFLYDVRYYMRYYTPKEYKEQSK